MAYLQVSFCCKGSPTDGAGKWLFTSVGPFVDLKGTGRGEVLPTCSADVLFGRTAEFGPWHEERGNTRGESWWPNEMASANGTLTMHLHLYEGWWGSNESSWNAASTWKERKPNVYTNLLLLPSSQALPHWKQCLQNPPKTHGKAAITLARMLWKKPVHLLFLLVSLGVR